MKKKFSEDAPTNATGGAVVGTGDDKTTWKRKKKKSKIVKRLRATYEVGRKPDKELVLKKEGTFIEMRGGFQLNKHQPRNERPASPTKSWNVDKGDKVTLKPQDREYPNQTGTITKVVGIDKRYGRGGVVTYKIKVKGKTIERKTYELVFEGKNMDWLHKLIKQGKSAEEISRIMELDRDTVEALMERNYRKEDDNYHAQPEQREKNAARLRARRLMVKKGKVKKNDKMDVHHKDNNPLNNDTKNLSVVTQKYNRTEPRLRKEDADVAPTPDSTFASMPVFKVKSDDFVRCQDVKKKYARWNKHIDTESDYGKKIHGYAKKNPKSSIIVQDDKSGHMVYLKKYSQLEK